MALLKQIELPNGVLSTHHKIVAIRTNSTMSALEVQVGSWANEASFIANTNPIWNEYIEIPIEDLVLRAENAIKTTAIFENADQVVNVTDLETTKQKKRSDIKLRRSVKEYGGFIWDGSVFDSDLASQGKIQGAVQLAQIAKASNTPFIITWTLLNNTLRTLTADEMIAVGVALGTHIESVYQISQQLSIQIQNATTIEQVQAIDWPISQ